MGSLHVMISNLPPADAAAPLPAPVPRPAAGVPVEPGTRPSGAAPANAPSGDAGASEQGEERLRPGDPPLPPHRAPRRLIGALVTADSDESDALLRDLENLLRARGHAVQLIQAAAATLPVSHLSFLALDVETTGLNPHADRVIELGVVEMRGGLEHAAQADFVCPDRPISAEITHLTGIRTEDVAHAAPFATHAPELLARLGAVDFVVAYNARFDRSFLQAECARIGLTMPDVPWVDPFAFLHDAFAAHDLSSKRLTDVARALGVETPQAHRALADARTAAHVFLKLLPRLSVTSLEALLQKQDAFARARDQTRAAREPLPPPEAPERQSLGARILSLFR